jgi:hypothetical protein
LKAIFVGLAGILIASAAVAAEPPSLVGTWKGPLQRIGLSDGWVTEGEVTIEVTEQRGALFKARATYADDGAEMTSDFVGAIAHDGKSAVGADADGVLSLSLPEPGVLDVCYIESGEDAAASCARFTRQAE